MSATIYNEIYNEIGVAATTQIIIEMISIRAAAARGEEITVYAHTDVDKTQILRIDAHFEADKRKIVLECSVASEAACAAIAAKQSEAVRKEITDIHQL